jgi:hypothetical protein
MSALVQTRQRSSSFSGFNHVSAAVVHQERPITFHLDPVSTQDLQSFIIGMDPDPKWENCVNVGLIDKLELEIESVYIDMVYNPIENAGSVENASKLIRNLGAIGTFERQVFIIKITEEMKLVDDYDMFQDIDNINYIVANSVARILAPIV